MSRCKAFFKQQAHRVALIAKGRLNADENIAKLFAKHMDRPTVGLLLAGCRAPLLFNRTQPLFAPHVVISGNAMKHIGE